MSCSMSWHVIWCHDMSFDVMISSHVMMSCYVRMSCYVIISCDVTWCHDVIWWTWGRRCGSWTVWTASSVSVLPDFSPLVSPLAAWILSHLQRSSFSPASSGLAHYRQEFFNLILTLVPTVMNWKYSQKVHSLATLQPLVSEDICRQAICVSIRQQRQTFTAPTPNIL